MSQTETLPTAPPTHGGDDEVLEQMLPEVLKYGGGGAVLYLLALSLIKEWVVIGPAHRREVADIAAQRDRALDKVDRLLDINATQSDALHEFARGENLGAYALEAIKQRAAENDGGGDT